MISPRLLPLLGYLILAAGVLSANLIAYDASRETDRKQITEQRAGCERTNDLRRQINSQNAAILRQADITYSLFGDITKGLPRESPLRHRIDAAIRDRDEVSASFSPIPTIDCRRAYRAESATP